MINSLKIFFLSLLLLSCTNNNRNKLTATKTFETEIPIYKQGLSKGDTSYSFLGKRKREKELDLESIENGFDSLQIRIWLGHSLALTKNVVILKLKDGVWTGQLLTYTIGHNDSTGKSYIASKELKNIESKMSLAKITTSIKDFQILTLPNCEEIRGYDACGGHDGITYSFEVSTKTKYRFYYYCNPDYLAERFWQAKNVILFASILEKELGFEYMK